MFQTYFYTIFIVFACIQVIYIFLFYRLEQKQKERVTTKLLHSTKGIYVTLFSLILGIPTVTIITSAITGSWFFSGAEIGLYIYGLIIGIIVFFQFNSSVIKGYNGLYFYDDKFLDIRYSVLLSVIHKEQIAIKDINTVRIVYSGKGRLLHLTFNDGKEDYFYMQYINSRNLESYFLHRKLEPEVLRIKVSEFKRLEKKV